MDQSHKVTTPVTPTLEEHSKSLGAHNGGFRLKWSKMVSGHWYDLKALQGILMSSQDLETYQ